MTTYRFRRYADGSISVRAQRTLGKQLVMSITKLLAPGEDVSTAMRELYKEAHSGPAISPFAQGRANEPGVGE